MVKVKLFEAGTQLHLTLSPGLTDGATLTLNMFTSNSIDARIWEEYKPIRDEKILVGQAFIDVDDFLRAADLIREKYYHHI